MACTIQKIISSAQVELIFVGTFLAWHFVMLFSPSTCITLISCTFLISVGRISFAVLENTRG